MKRYRYLVALMAALTIGGLNAPTMAASLVTNSDFETDNGETPAGPLGWFTGGPTDYVLDDDSDGDGSRSIEITADAGDWRSEAIFVTPGDELTWGLDYKFLDGTAGEFSADLRFFSGFDALSGGTAGAFQGEQRIVTGASANGEWQSFSNTFEVPAGALTADVRISSSFFDAGLTGGGVRFDAIDVRVPEPTSMILGGLGVLGLGFSRRRR